MLAPWGSSNLAQLARLQELLGISPPEIVATLIVELQGAVDQLDLALHAHDTPAAALAAHAARNSALMVGAAELLGALGLTEQSARQRDLDGALNGLAQIRRCWPGLRRQLKRPVDKA